MSLIKKIQFQLGQLPKKGKIVVACSGGVDSITLLHLLKNSGSELIVAHFNHGWRGAESDADEKFIQDLAQKWNLPIEIGRGQRAEKGNAENEARKARYAFLEQIRQKHKAQWIALGHHRDDQIETILMHQKRGAGLRGWAGMSFQREALIRPLLEESKVNLLNYAKLNQLTWKEDRSNQDLTYTRNQLRQIEIPKLRQQEPDFEEKLLQRSREAKEQLVHLGKLADKWLENDVYSNEFTQKDFLTLEKEVQVEILIRLLGQVDLYQSTFTRIQQWLKGGRSGSCIQVKQWILRQEQGRVRIQKVQMTSTPPPKIPLNGEALCWGPWRLQQKTGKRLFVRSWEPGDRFQPSGMKGHKKLQDFFVDAKIPKSLRESIPLIVDEKNTILSVSNLRFAQEAGELKKSLTVEIL